MGRLTGVDSMGLDLPRLAADFYLLEMAVNHIPNGPATPVFERYVNDIAPKICRTLEYSISTELGFAHNVHGPEGRRVREEGDCPQCKGEWYLEKCHDGGAFYANGCGESHLFIYCPGCESHFIPGERVKNRSQYPKSTVYFHSNHAGSQAAYNAAFEKYGRDFLADNAIAFRDGDWSSGYGGSKWATIAEVVRDYELGVIRPRTFLDRAWTLQHNNASVFDKIYSTGKLMQVLEIQADNDYETLGREFASLYAAQLFRRMERWVGVYSVDTEYGRRVPDWIGTGD